MSIGGGSGPHIGIQTGPPLAASPDGSARAVGAGRGCGDGASAGWVIVGATFEAPTVVSSLDDVAVMGQPIEQSGRHLGVDEDARPFAEGEIGGDDDGGALVEAADKVEQELTTGLGKGQISEFIEDDEVHAGEVIGQTALAGVTGLGLEPIDEIDDVVATSARSNAASGDGDCKMGLAGSSPADQDDIALLSEESATGEIAHQRLIDGRARELEVIEVLGERQLGNGELVFDRARLLLVDLGGEQVADDALRLMLALDRSGHDLVEGGLH